MNFPDFITEEVNEELRDVCFQQFSIWSQQYADQFAKEQQIRELNLLQSLESDFVQSAKPFLKHIHRLEEDIAELSSNIQTIEEEIITTTPNIINTCVDEEFTQKDHRKLAKFERYMISLIQRQEKHALRHKNELGILPYERKSDQFQQIIDFFTEQSCLVDLKNETLEKEYRTLKNDIETLQFDDLSREHFDLQQKIADVQYKLRKEKEERIVTEQRYVRSLRLIEQFENHTQIESNLFEEIKNIKKNIFSMIE
ncbi:hypothetical protein PCE1_001802 [Barthelona sp. PCE]